MFQVFTVATSSEFASAFTKASGGDTILLSSGTYALKMVNKSFLSPGIIIASADPAKPAVLSGITIGAVSNVAMSDLEFTAEGTTDPYWVFRVGKASNISFDRCNIHGDPAKSTETSVVDQPNGFLVSECSGVYFRNCDFHDLDSAVTVGKTSTIELVSCVVRRVDKGGFHLGACTGVKIWDNSFTEFLTGPGTHADAVQFYTSNTVTPSKNVSIKGNLFVRGKGWAPQGILIQDEVGTLPIEGVEITNNAFLGAQWNSIVVKGAAGAIVVKDNMVASWPGVQVNSTSPGDFKGVIRVDGDLSRATLDVRGNTAQSYILPGVAPGKAPVGNALIGSVGDGGLALTVQWALNRPLGH